nr:hypothetical protein GCM10020093_059400 [Planobispora longispora]
MCIHVAGWGYRLLGSGVGPRLAAEADAGSDPSPVRDRTGARKEPESYEQITVPHRTHGDGGGSPGTVGFVLAIAGDRDDPSDHSEWSGSAFFKTSSQQAGPTGASSTHTVSGAD